MVDNEHYTLRGEGEGASVTSLASDCKWRRTVNSHKKKRKNGRKKWGKEEKKKGKKRGRRRRRSELVSEWRQRQTDI